MEDNKEKVVVSDATQMKIDAQPEPFEPSANVHAPGTSGGAADVLVKGSIGLRRIALLLSLVSFVLVVFMVSRKHGALIDVSMRKEFRYKLKHLLFQYFRKCNVGLLEFWLKINGFSTKFNFV